MTYCTECRRDDHRNPGSSRPSHSPSRLTDRSGTIAAGEHGSSSSPRPTPSRQRLADHEPLHRATSGSTTKGAPPGHPSASRVSRSRRIRPVSRAPSQRNPRLRPLDLRGDHRPGFRSQRVVANAGFTQSAVSRNRTSATAIDGNNLAAMADPHSGRTSSSDQHAPPGIGVSGATWQFARIPMPGPTTRTPAAFSELAYAVAANGVVTWTYTNPYRGASPIVNCTVENPAGRNPALCRGTRRSRRPTDFGYLRRLQGPAHHARIDALPP